MSGSTGPYLYSAFHEIEGHERGVRDAATENAAHAAQAVVFQGAVFDGAVV